MLPIRAGELLANHPASVRRQLAAELPGVDGVPGFEVLDAGLLQRLADRLEELLAVFLDQRLEERQPEDLAFAFVDAGGQVLEEVLGEHVSAEERSPAVS